MNIAVTTPTGHVGRAVTDFLLECSRDINVTLLGRRPEKLQDFVRRGANTAIGALDDTEYVVKATKGMDALFWATPPVFGSDDLRGFQNRLANAAATAIRTNRIHRVVNLSSIGADVATGAGPISGLHDVEEQLNKIGCHVTHLRPGFFFENILWQLDTIRTWGRISWPINPSVAYPMIATHDIGRAAATRLVNMDWTGHVVQELHGPADLTFREVADILSQVLGRKIVYVRTSREDARDAMLQKAMSENVAQSMLEMYDALDTGKVRPLQPRTPDTATPTTLAEFAREVVLPLISQPVGATRENA
ncbi:MAG: NmrA family NAD(P)-binding protein [Planctomycetaceae bacterium]|nr:NmrA family NAD(P)-binding protein [Planctomycetaceae bacterium]